MTEYPNVIFIVIDTLRKDYAKPLEEVLKKLGFILYENVIAPASWTIPSHASIFTGLYPALHGAHESKNKKIGKNILRITKYEILISSTLKELGYTNYLFTANTFISPLFGFTYFDKIFESSEIPTFLSIEEQLKLNSLHQDTRIKTLLNILTHKELKLFIKLLLNPIGNSKPYRYIYSLMKNWPLDKGISKFIKILDSLNIIDTPVFMFYNLMEVHEPYQVFDYGRKIFVENLKTNKLDDRLVQKWREKYPKEVKYITRKLLELLNVLKKRNLFDNSLIIITSDHGQLLGEHGRISHGTFLYDELLKVPLLVKYPKGYEIEHVWDKSKYISLVKLKPFILEIIENKLNNDSILYSDIVFAESYGVHTDIGNISNKTERKNIEQLDKYRIAIYYKNFKGIFNVEEWKFEDIISYDSKTKTEVTEDVIKHMKKEILKFLKTATVAKVPKIKI